MPVIGEKRTRPGKDYPETYVKCKCGARRWTSTSNIQDPSNQTCHTCASLAGGRKAAQRFGKGLDW